MVPRVTLAASEDTIATDADGQRYTVKRIAKKDVEYRALGDGWVRVAPYFQYRLEREDADYLYVREYIAPPAATVPAPQAARPPLSDVTPGPEVELAGGIAEVDRIALLPYADGLPSAGQWRNGFSVADMNGDGQLDIVHGPPRKAGGGPRIFLGDGGGHWTTWTEASFPPGAYDYGAVAVADFDRDSHLDLALAAHLTGITILLGDGHGHFRLGNTPADLEPDAAHRFTTRALIAHDWDGDGAADLVACGEGPNQRGGGSFGWVVYLNRGDGHWQKQAQTGSAPRTFGDDLAVGDFNGDGHTDLATASLNFGNRHFVHYGGAEMRSATIDAVGPDALVFSVVAADFDADGRDDLALGYLRNDAGTWHSLIDVLLAQPHEGWRRVALQDRISRSATYALAAGDVDGDGHRDLAALDDSGGVRLFLGDGSGGFARQRTTEVQSIGTGCRGYHVALVDLNHDGRDEVLASFAGEASAAGGESGCPNGGGLRAWTPTRTHP
jgi:FG-GAP-like repeat